MPTTADTLVIASGNRGKLTEFAALLQDLGQDLGLGVNARPQSDFHIQECDETGLSFVENAILKARNAAAGAGLPALADDSGIEVDALHGAPGIYSARYAGAGASDQDNRRKLLTALADVPREQRGASFRCVIVYLRHAEDPSPLIADGSWRGEIAAAERGSGGFGYDPLFFLPELGKTAAELSAAEKNRRSHRAAALAALKPALAQQLAR